MEILFCCDQNSQRYLPNPERNHEQFPERYVRRRSLRRGYKINGNNEHKFLTTFYHVKKGQKNKNYNQNERGKVTIPSTIDVAVIDASQESDLNNEQTSNLLLKVI